MDVQAHAGPARLRRHLVQAGDGGIPVHLGESPAGTRYQGPSLGAQAFAVPGGPTRRVPDVPAAHQVVEQTTPHAGPASPAPAAGAGDLVDHLLDLEDLPLQGNRRAPACFPIRLGAAPLLLRHLRSSLLPFGLSSLLPFGESARGFQLVGLRLAGEQPPEFTHLGVVRRPDVRADLPDRPAVHRLEDRGGHARIGQRPQLPRRNVEVDRGFLDPPHDLPRPNARLRHLQHVLVPQRRVAPDHRVEDRRRHTRSGQRHQGVERGVEVRRGAFDPLDDPFRGGAGHRAHVRVGHRPRSPRAPQGRPTQPLPFRRPTAKPVVGDVPADRGIVQAPGARFERRLGLVPNAEQVLLRLAVPPVLAQGAAVRQRDRPASVAFALDERSLLDRAVSAVQSPCAVPSASHVRTRLDVAAGAPHGPVAMLTAVEEGALGPVAGIRHQLAPAVRTALDAAAEPRPAVGHLHAAVLGGDLRRRMVRRQPRYSRADCTAEHERRERPFAHLPPFGCGR